MIEIKYICGFCSMDEIKLSVRDRGPDEDILHYMETVITQALSDDHSIRAPHCRTQSFKQVMIKLGGPRIGDPYHH